MMGKKKKAKKAKDFQEQIGLELDLPEIRRDEYGRAVIRTDLSRASLEEPLPLEDRELVFNVPAAVAATEVAVERSDHESLRASFDLACLDACQDNELVTADEVWAARGSIPASRAEASGLGPAMRRAVHGGLMVATGAYRPSLRPEAHRKPLPVYRSLIWRGL